MVTYSNRISAHKHNGKCNRNGNELIKSKIIATVTQIQKENCAVCLPQHFTTDVSHHWWMVCLVTPTAPYRLSNQFYQYFTITQHYLVTSIMMSTSLKF